MKNLFLILLLAMPLSAVSQSFCGNYFNKRPTELLELNEITSAYTELRRATDEISIIEQSKSDLVYHRQPLNFWISHWVLMTLEEVVLVAEIKII